MNRILVTSDFCKESEKLKSRHNLTELHDLRTVLILLANDKPIPKRFKDHQLTGREFRELHISGDVLLLYKRDFDKDLLIVSLKIANITSHNRLNSDSARTDYDYHEVSTQELHDITSSTKIDSAMNKEILNDLLESISDYASMNLSNGFVLLDDYTLQEDRVIATYDYYLSGSNVVADSVDLLIRFRDFDASNVSDLASYIDYFSELVNNAFE